ncbi:uncharacterized protein LOC116917561 isoform X2 [Daphnia magna]|nr:uncharacterized protein LOC116917561 isoform X2 [Daphnia magna]
MVRYRPEAGERGYTFRLVNNNGNNGDVNGGSPTGTLISDHSGASTLDSSVYKERIDSLFRQQHLRRHANETQKPLVEEEDDAAVNEPTMEHLQLHFQKVLAEQRGNVASPVPATPSTKNHSTTYIQVNNHVNHTLMRESTPESRAQRFNEARTAVQAQIEKMFQDASTTNGQQPNKTAMNHHVSTSSPSTVNDPSSSVINITNHKAVINVRSDYPLPPTQKAVHNKQNVPLPPIPAVPPPSPPSSSAMTNTNQYKVDYLGSLSLPGRATSLESLQFPLKELYSQYRQHENANRNQIYRGTMEISPAGLKIQYYLSDSRRPSVPQEVLNPFPTIAVWAAVKFVARTESTGRKFAFLPLICDPENQDKQNLFHPLSAADDGDWVTSPTFHPPLFTCVMRNTQAPKDLECHAFVCDNPEDAIVIAANLYQALLRNMKNNESSQQQPQQQPPPPQQQAPPPPPTSATPVNKIAQPIYSPSTSVSNWSESSVTSSFQQPVRPPRRKKSTKPLDGGLERRKSIRRSQNKTRSSQGKANLRRSMRNASQRSNTGRVVVKRSVSERHLGEVLTSDGLDGPDQSNNGDILTKVAIPRSKSFMTVPQQNYSFSELFEELKKREGVRSVDDVLKTIVNKDRMSFNDLTPAYKEMLMKLALTLSKDEMFQRSKNIMRHQTSNLSKTKSKGKADVTRNETNKLAARDSDAEHSTSSSRISSVLRATKKSFSKWGAARSVSTGYSVTKEEKQASEPQLIKNIKIIKSPEPSIVSVAPLVFPTKHFNPKTPLPPRSVVANNKNGIVNKAPDYSASCSECGYDSESCSHKCYCSFNETQSQDTTDYSDAERCYCSLKRISKSSGAPVYRIRLDSDDTDTSHDSLPDPAVRHPPHIKPTKNRPNYARKSSSMTSWSALSGAESPLTAWRRNTANLQHSAPATTTKPSAHPQSTRFTLSSASSLRQKSLSSYLSDTSLDSDVVAMTEPAHKSANGKSSFAKQPEILRRKSRSSYLSSETEMDSTSCNSFVRGPISLTNQQQRLQRKTSPAESVGYQSYDSTGSSGRTSRNFSLENLSSVSDDRRNSNSSSDRSLKSQNSVRGNKFLMVSAVDPKGKIVYRGTSSAGSTHHSQHHHRSVAKTVPEGALSAKKTTEIAAMFSNIKLNQTTDIVIDDSEVTEDTASEISTDDAYSSMHYRGAVRNNKNGFSKRSELENSLGYLP